MRIFLVSLTCLLASIFTVGFAQAEDCSNASDQAMLNACAGKQLKTVDAQLNKLYNQIRQRFGDDKQTIKLLVAAQKAWIGFRDAECAFSSSGVSGGSVYPLIHTNCIAGLTEKRIDDFKTYLKCEEGDMSCPVLAN